VTPVAGLVTSEAGGTPPAFDVVLDSQPTADVVIPVGLERSLRGWGLGHEPDVHRGGLERAADGHRDGVDDAVDDGDIAYTIVTGAAASDDANYAGDRSGRRGRGEHRRRCRGHRRDAGGRPRTTEAGGSASFSVVLESQPTADVVIPIASSDPTEGGVSAASLTFTAADWNVPQTVTVTGVDDAADDGDIAYSIATGAAASDDANYAAIDPADVEVVNADDDAAGIDVTPVAGLGTTEAGGTASFSVVLTSQPSADVVIPIASSDATEGAVPPRA
jgi:hypothetical protein